MGGEDDYKLPSGPLSQGTSSLMDYDPDDLDGDGEPDTMSFLRDTVDVAEEMGELTPRDIAQLGERVRQQNKHYQSLFQRMDRHVSMMDRRIAIQEQQLAAMKGNLREVAIEVVDKERERSSSRLERLVERLSDDLDSLGHKFRDKAELVASKEDHELLRTAVNTMQQTLQTTATKAWCLSEFGSKEMQEKHSSYFTRVVWTIVSAVLTAVIGLVIAVKNPF